MAGVRRILPAEPVDLARSLVPIGLLALGAVAADLRPVVLLLLVTGTVIAIRRDAPVRWAWGAAVPVAVSLTWGAVVASAADPTGADCASPTSPFAAWRAVEAVVVLGTVVAIALALRATTTSLALRWPARRYIRWAVVGFVVAGPLGLVLGPILARPFFGDVGYDLTLVGAIVPALVFAVANGTMEEVIFRGALLGWSARVMGVGPALIGQAVVFGLAHSGPDVVGSPIPLMLLLGLGGFLAGLITIRTRSLLIPIAVHVGLDLPLYYALACPAG